MAIRELSLRTRLWLHTLFDHLQNWHPSVASLSEKRRWLELSALEERVFLSASPAGAVVPDSAPLVVPAPQPEGDAPAASGDVDPLLAALEVETAVLPDQLAEQPNSSTHELVLIDGGVRDVDVLLNDLRLSPEPGRTVEIIQLDAQRDGVQQISEILANHHNLDAVHVVSHGRDGAVKLGNHWLDGKALQASSDAISQWQLAFSDEGDFLFYGCDLAATEKGQEFVNAFAELTGTEVAASVDATGATPRGGDWDLEYQTGSVESDLAFSQTAQQDYDQLLATLTVETTNDILDGDTTSIAALLSNKGSDGVISLREAIMASNNTAGADDIFLSAGTYTLSLGSGDDNGSAGDLDILDDLTITGADAGTTIIDGAGLDRVFHIHNNSTVVSMSGLTIRGGSTTNNGAGVYVDQSSTLNLTDAILTDNNGNGGDGGAIYVRGTLNLDRVLLSNNSASNGGGVYFHSADGGSLINVTISGNTADSQAGGLWTDSSLTITNATITANNASEAGGVYRDNGTVVLTNTILGGNTATTSSPDVAGSFSSGGFNLIQDTSGAAGFIGSDLLGVDPLLNPLGNYGGSIPTHSLQSLSPALNAGTTAGAPAVDGRNVTRDAAPDIGAFERITQLAPTNEFRVNTTTTDTQATTAADRGSHQAVAMSASGDYVVVWSSRNQDGDGWGLYGQRFDRMGTALGTEFLINETTAGNQQFANVAMNDSGQFVVAWSEDQTGNIYAQRFNEYGAQRGGNLLINTTTAGSQTNPSVALNNEGLVVVVWEGNGLGDSSGVFGQRFDFDGSNTGTEFRINTTTLGTQADASVSINQSGQFVVSWDNGSSFYAQRFDADGNADGGEILIQSALLATNGNGAVAIGEDGSFVATWMEDVLILLKEVYVRRYDASGNALGAAELVNTTTSGTQTSPSISMDLAGNSLIVWEGNGPGDSSGVFGQKFDANGNAVGGEIRINQTTSGTQALASAALYDLDNFVVVWSGNGAGDTDGVFARQFGTASANAYPIINSAAFSVSESAANGTSIGNIAASDPDVGDTLTFSYTGGPSGVLALDSHTGELTLADNSFLNFEVSQTFTITVRAVDNNLLSTTAIFTIHVTDANEDPTINSTSISIDENAAPGTLAGTITASDPDAGDTYTLAIVGGDPAGLFELDQATGNLQLTSLASLDFETASQHSLQIQVTDAGGLQSLKTVVVQVNDVNETPLLNDASFDIADNAANGTLVGALNGLDADAGDSLTYEILAGNEAGVFSVDAATGKLLVADSTGLDFQAMPQFQLTVQVTDAMGLADIATVTINLVASNVQPQVANPTFTIDENSPVGTKLGTVSATDPHGDTPLSYSLVNGNLDEVFEIDSQTGEIRVANAERLNYEHQTHYTLVVQVTNASGVSNVGVVQIQVNDLNEPPVAVDDALGVDSTAFVLDPKVFIRNDIHPEGERLIVVGFANFGAADIIDNGDHTYLYVLPEDSLGGIYTFTYFIQDVTGRTSSAQVTIDLQRDHFRIEQRTNRNLDESRPGANSPPQIAPQPQTQSQTQSQPGLQLGPQLRPGQPVSIALALDRIEPSAQREIPSNSEEDSSPQGLPLGTGVFLAPAPGGLNSSHLLGAAAPEATLLEPLPQASPQNQPGFTTILNDSEPLDSPGLETFRSEAMHAQANNVSSIIDGARSSSSPASEPTETAEFFLQEIGEGSQVWQDLNQMEEAVEAEMEFQALVVGTAVTVTSSLTIGYAIWTIRGGVLLGSLLTQMPAWRFLDPLPVLEHLANREDESQDQESLESIIDTAGVS